MQELNSGQLGTVQRPVREVDSIGLPGIRIEELSAAMEGDGFSREFDISVPGDGQFLRLAIPKTAGLEKAWVNGELALDNSLESKHKRWVDTLQVMYPEDGKVKVELLSSSPDAFTMAAVTWHELPGILIAPFMGNWPDDARPYLYGPRAEKIQEYEFGAIQAVAVPP